MCGQALQRHTTYSVLYIFTNTLRTAFPQIYKHSKPENRVRIAADNAPAERVSNGLIGDSTPRPAKAMRSGGGNASSSSEWATGTAGWRMRRQTRGEGILHSAQSIHSALGNSVAQGMDRLMQQRASLLAANSAADVIGKPARLRRLVR